MQTVALKVTFFSYDLDKSRQSQFTKIGKFCSIVTAKSKENKISWSRRKSLMLRIAGSKDINIQIIENK